MTINSTKPVITISSQHKSKTSFAKTSIASQQQPLQRIFPKIEATNQSRHQHPHTKVTSNVPLCTFTKSQLEKVLNFMEKKNPISSSSPIVAKIFPKTNLSSVVVGKLASNQPSSVLKKEIIQAKPRLSAFENLALISNEKVVPYPLPGVVSTSDYHTHPQISVGGKMSNLQTSLALLSTTIQERTSNQFSVASSFNIKTNQQFQTTASLAKLISNKKCPVVSKSDSKTISLSSSTSGKTPIDQLSSYLGVAIEEAPDGSLEQNNDVVSTNTSIAYKIPSSSSSTNTQTIRSTSQSFKNGQIEPSQTSQTTYVTACTNTTFGNIPSSIAVIDLKTTNSDRPIASIQNQSSTTNITDIFVKKLDDLTDFLQTNDKVLAKQSDTLLKSSNLLSKMEDLAKLLETKHNTEETQQYSTKGNFLEIIS